MLTRQHLRVFAYGYLPYRDLVFKQIKEHLTKYAQVIKITLLH